MGMLLTATALFLLTLVLPAFANMPPLTPEEVAARVARLESESAMSAEKRAGDQRRILADAVATAATLNDQIKYQRELSILTEQQSVLTQQTALSAERYKLALEEAKPTTAATTSAITNLRTAVATLEVKTRDAERAFRKFKREAEESAAAIDGLAADMRGLLGITEDLSGSFTYRLGTVLKTAAADARGFGAGIKEMMNVIAAEVPGLSVLEAQMRKVTEASIAVAKAQDQAISSFMRATGVSAGYDDVMESAFMNTRQFGVSAAEAGQATQALYSEMAAFSRESRSVQTNLVQTVALMGEVGVSASSAAQALDTMTKTLHMSAIEAGNLSKQLIQTAVDIGIPPARLMQELAASAPQLAQWGDQTVNVFLALERAAKGTGMAIGELIGITKQYDTFYGAAEAAGRLNAVLGGPYLNSIELLNANEEQRIRLLVQSIELSGRSWSSLNRFEKQAVAAAAGISDMSAASRIFGQSLSEYDNAQRAVRATAEEQRNLAERAAQAQTVYEMMTAAINSMAVSLKPLVSFLRDLFEILARLTSFVTNSPFLSFLVQSALAGKTLIMIGVPLFSTLTTIAGALSLVGPAAGQAAAGVAAFKTAMMGLMATGAIGAVAMALGYLTGLFEPHSPSFADRLGLSAENMQRLGAAASSVLGPITALSKVMPITADAVVRIGTIDASEAMGIKTRAIPLMAGISGQEISQMRTAAAAADMLVSGLRTSTNQMRGWIQEAVGIGPALRDVANTMPTLAMTLESRVTADANQILRARSAGVAEIRAQNMDVRDSLERLITSNEFYARRVEAAATGDTVLRMSGREMGRATKAIINRELRSRQRF